MQGSVQPQPQQGPSPERAINAILKNFDSSRDVTRVGTPSDNIANSLAGANPAPNMSPVPDPRADPRTMPNPSYNPKVPDFINQTPSASDILNSVLTGQAPAPEQTPAQVRAELEARNKSEPQAAEPVAQEPVAQAADDVEQLVSGDDVELPSTHPIAENFKKLKKAYRETKDKYKEIENKYTAAESRLKEYETGAAVPEIVQNLENKVAAATKWEKLHNLKMSEEYQKEFAEPLNETTNKLKAIATDYGYEENLLDQALKLNSESQLNGFLSEHFDPVGAVEIKQLVAKAKDISMRAKAAESEPEAVMQRLREEQEIRFAAQEEQRINKISNTAKAGWQEAIEAIQKEGRMTEIVSRPDDPEHNEMFVKPILQQAGQEFGKIVTMLTKAGLKELPSEVSKALATMTARALASSVAVASRESAVKQLSEMEAVLARVTNAKSPNIGAASGRGTGEPAQASPRGYAGDTTLSTAANLLSSVLGSRK